MNSLVPYVKKNKSPRDGVTFKKLETRRILIMRKCFRPHSDLVKIQDAQGCFRVCIQK